MIYSLMFLLSCLLPAKTSFEFDVSANYRDMSASTVKDNYGAGIIFVPVLEIKVFKGFYLGASYDFGYSKSATIGYFQENSTLKINSWDLFISYHFGGKSFVPYLKAGAGFSKYDQDIESEVITPKTVSESKTGWMAGVGFKYFFGKTLYLKGEVRYSPFKVDGANDSQIDIGGIKTGLGLGIKF